MSCHVMSCHFISLHVISLLRTSNNASNFRVKTLRKVAGATDGRLFCWDCSMGTGLRDLLSCD